MKLLKVLVLVYCASLSSADQETRDLQQEEDSDLERKHHKKKNRYQGYQNPCYGGYGKVADGKFFGFTEHTYVSAPVNNNYYLGCGGYNPAPPPVYPVPVQPIPYPVQIGVSQSQHHSHGSGGHGGHGGLFGGGGMFSGPSVNYPGYQGYPSGLPGPYPPVNRPIQNLVSAAASGLGNVLADYVSSSRPKKVYRQFNRQVNSLLRPIYKLF